MTAASTTLVEELAKRLRASIAAPDGLERPVAILWTDPSGQWGALKKLLLEAMPELVVLGAYDPAARTGPAIWVRCVVDRTLPVIPADRVPIVYLPKVGRQHLRAGSECPAELQPLVELMFRGTLWLQKGGHDWTVTSFLTSPQGMGFDLARDDATVDALLRALPDVATSPAAHFAGRRLEAADFDRLLTPDVTRDLLRWMGEPAAVRERMGSERWGAFRSQCQAQFAFDPEKDGAVAAGQRLGAGGPAWDEVWRRFEEAPTAYPGIADLLRRSKPGSGNLFDRARWPDENDKAEERLRRKLERTDGDLRADVLELEAEHGVRRRWIWSRIGQSPLAAVLEHLAELARITAQSIGGARQEDLAKAYMDHGWRADAAAWRALAIAPPRDEALIRNVVQMLQEPWADESARVLQKVLAAKPPPGHAGVDVVAAEEGGALLFSDGLRYDLGCILAEELERRGLRVRLRSRWAALPTVTATGKPAITPVAGNIEGGELGETFSPAWRDKGKAVDAPSLRAAIEQKGYQILGKDLGDWPAKDDVRGWLEYGEIDQLGHDVEVPVFVRQLADQVARIAERIAQLLAGGWKSVRIVTDHGWLLLPNGLPQVDLPKHLTASRWSRCAAIAGGSQVSVPTGPWHWNALQQFATGPGIACFNKSPAYAHGGISLQECLTPDLLVEPDGAVAVRASFRSVTWRNLRCFVVVDCSAPGVRVDLRLESAHGAPVVKAPKAVDGDGAASLVLTDDEHERAELVLVLLGPDEAVLAQMQTKVGMSS
jgi:hypothetical protein